MQEVRNVRIVSCKNIVKSIKCREIRYCLRKIDKNENQRDSIIINENKIIKEGERMNFKIKEQEELYQLLCLSSSLPW